MATHITHNKTMNKEYDNEKTDKHGFTDLDIIQLGKEILADQSEYNEAEQLYILKRYINLTKK